MKIGLILACFLLIPPLISGQASDPIALKVIDDVITKAQANEVLKTKYLTYQRHTIVKDLEYSPPPSKARVSLIFGRNNKSYEKLIEENGRKVRNGKEDAGSFDQVDLYEAMKTRYEYTTSNPQLQLLDGHVVLVVNFKPKDKSQLPFETNADEVINRIKGTFWIDIANNTVLKFEAHLPEPFSKAWGLFSMSTLDMTIEQEEKFGIMVPKKTTYTVKYRALISSTHEEQTSTYSDHIDLRLANQPPPP